MSFLIGPPNILESIAQIERHVAGDLDTFDAGRMGCVVFGVVDWIMDWARWAMNLAVAGYLPARCRFVDCLVSATVGADHNIISSSLSQHPRPPRRLSVRYLRRHRHSCSPSM